MPNPFPVLLPPSTTIVGSPALAAETTVASTVVGGVAGPSSRVLLIGFVALTVGTSGTAVRIRLRNGSITGTVVGDTGAMTAVAANLVSFAVLGVDSPGDVSSLAYVMTAQVTAGAAVSTVSSVQLVAVVFG